MGFGLVRIGSPRDGSPSRCPPAARRSHSARTCSFPAARSPRARTRANSGSASAACRSTARMQSWTARRSTRPVGMKPNSPTGVSRAAGHQARRRSRPAPGSLSSISQASDTIGAGPTTGGGGRFLQLFGRQSKRAARRAVECEYGPDRTASTRIAHARRDRQRRSQQRLRRSSGRHHVSRVRRRRNRRIHNPRLENVGDTVLAHTTVEFKEAPIRR